MWPAALSNLELLPTTQRRDRLAGPTHAPGRVACVQADQFLHVLSPASHRELAQNAEVALTPISKRISCLRASHLTAVSSCAFPSAVELARCPSLSLSFDLLKLFPTSATLSTLKRDQSNMSELASLASASNGTPPPDEREHELETFLQPLILDEGSLHTLAYQFSAVYKDLALHSDEQFLPTPVTRLPSGGETGQYLAIDVGGTNLRVAFIELLGEQADRDVSINGPERSRETIKKAQRPRVRRTLEKAWPIGEHLKMDKAEDLFSWIGDCIAEVVADRLSADAARMPMPDELKMGITFSFPML